MPVTPDAVEHLRRGGHEAVHAARREGRVVVTADPRLLALEAAEDLVYADREMLDLLDRVLATVAEVELERSVTVVDRHRIRRRRLPIL